MDYPQFLTDRYALVAGRFIARFPDEPPPPMPENDPNAVVRVINEMMARLDPTNVERFVVREGDPIVVGDA